MNRVLHSLKKFWGFSDFLPLQQKAIESVLSARDSIVVLPTGGGKSLCYQAPAVSLNGYAIVVSPLISLMKDQVDSLTECGVAAARIDSSLPFGVHQFVMHQVRQGQLKILYVSPERLVLDSFLDSLRENPPSFVAVDEAHCVSMWGHDFRPEYCQLGILKKVFPEIAIHAYTATATRQVRNDIATQLGLCDPEILVGSFDRPNLLYKVQQRTGNGFEQVLRFLQRHRGESGVVYCIRRKDVDEMCQYLAGRGHRVAPYHAGMEDDARKSSQDDFINEKVDTIVATVAFGMGIDKSNVRYVVHAGMPKSLEHYQQESGRAGRDGLEAECLLLYSGRDFGVWRHIMRDMEPEPQKIAMRKLNAIYDFCQGAECRHQAILQYFGQRLDKDNCYACDICLGEMEQVPESLVTSQKILSCVVRLQQQCSKEYVASVLHGSKEQAIIEAGHHELSTYNLLSDQPLEMIRTWVEQLVSQKYLEKDEDTHALSVTEKGWLAIRAREAPRLFVPAPKADIEPAVSDPELESWEGVDKGLFEALRELRRSIAQDRNIPPYVVFSDATLRDMARKKPVSVNRFGLVKGVGQKKTDEYASAFLSVIREYCAQHAQPPEHEKKDAKEGAFIMFSQRKSIDEVSEKYCLGRSLVWQYLSEYVLMNKITSPEPWVDAQTFAELRKAVFHLNSRRLSWLHKHLQGKASFEQIRLCLACLGGFQA